MPGSWLCQVRVSAGTSRPVSTSGPAMRTASAVMGAGGSPAQPTVAPSAAASPAQATFDPIPPPRASIPPQAEALYTRPPSIPGFPDDRAPARPDRLHRLAHLVLVGRHDVRRR